MNRKPTLFDREIEKSRSFSLRILSAGLPVALLALAGDLFGWPDIIVLLINGLVAGLLLGTAVQDHDEFAKEQIGFAARMTVLALAAVFFFNIPGFSNDDKFWSAPIIFNALAIAFFASLWFRRIRG